MSRLKVTVAALGMMASLGVANVAQAAFIDDWNVNSAAQSVSPPGGAVARPAGGALLPGWTRSVLQASGGVNPIDSVAIADCPACEAGHFVNASAGVAGAGYWEWTGGPTSFNNQFMVDYQTDVAGGDLVLAFALGGIVQGIIQWGDLGVTGLNALPGPLAGGTLSGAFSGMADTIRLYAIASGGAFNDGWLAVNAGNAAPGLDLDVDNLRVPAPGVVALLGLGLAGLGWQRRKAAC